MAWAVDGCREWQRVGLKPPTAVCAATDEYFEAEDALGRWLDEACERGRNLTEMSGVLFAAWKVWAEANSEFVGSIERILREPFRAVASSPPGTGRARGFRGVALRQGGAGTDRDENFDERSSQ